MNDKLIQFASEVDSSVAEAFKRIDSVCIENTRRVMAAFSKYRISAEHLLGSSGYGYNDRGRDDLERIVADVFDAEDALVRPQIVSGTHAIATALYGVLRPGDTLYSVSGAPYDTLLETIGVEGNPGDGSLADFGVKYRKTDLLPDGTFNFEEILDTLKSDPSVKMVYIQRSRGYSTRRAIFPEEIGELAQRVKQVSDAIVFVDNCYGEFVCEKEPTAYGADLIAGSLIKNAGGGLAQTGGYIAGRADLVEKSAYRLTAVGLGKECGATLDQMQRFYQGFYLAPHVTAQALKTAVFAAGLFEKCGFGSAPSPLERRSDIVQTLTLGDRDKIISFCRAIQAASPIDSFAAPEPAPMPGYADDVIMAAGTFVQGASIELSCDAPLRPPFTLYLQGGLTYESGRLAVLSALEEVTGGNI